jgi:hypothetical protein
MRMFRILTSAGFMITEKKLKPVKLGRKKSARST